MRPRWFALAGAALLALTVPSAAIPQGNPAARETRIVSPPANAGLPVADGSSDAFSYSADGGHPGTRPNPVTGGDRPARNLTFSGDRQVRWLAYHSAATNLVPSDTNGARDVLLMRRTGRFDGTLSRVSVNSQEQQANGDSEKASIDGDSRHAATPCVVFQSKGTNLDPRDNDPDWDVYLRRGGDTGLVSVGLRSARDGVIDGECKTVTFESLGRVYVRALATRRTTTIGRGFNPDQQADGGGVAYDRRGQVYHQAFALRRGRVVRVGRERLVSSSATNSRRGGNGSSTDAHINENGRYVAFESRATNLCARRCTGISGDHNGALSDVFRRTTTSNEMQLVSWDNRRNLQSKLDADQVRLSAAGDRACFRSPARNLRDRLFRSTAIPDFTGPFMHIYVWSFRRGRGGEISGESRPDATGELSRRDRSAALSWSCDISARGNFIGFTSDAEDEAGESTGAASIPDAFIRFMGR